MLKPLAQPPKPRRNGLRIAIYLLAIITLVLGIWIFDYQKSIANLNVETAQHSATQLMERICAEQCAKRNIRREDMVGPTPDRGNMRGTGNKHYGFTWSYPNGELIIAVWDAGWWIDIDYWWRDK